MNRSNEMDIQTNEPQQRMVSPWEALKFFFTRLTPKGRSSRSEVWWAMLFVYGPLSVIARYIPRTTLGFILVALLHLLFSWPWFCLLARRLHDLDRHMGWAIAGLLVGWSGWLCVAVPMQMAGLMLVGFVIGGVLLVVSCTRSKMHPNGYGDIPNLIGTDDAVSHGAVTRAAPLSPGNNSSVMACPSCGKELKVPASCLGMECECPYCGKTIVVADDTDVLHSEQPSGKPPLRFSMIAMVVGIILTIVVVVIGIMVSNRFAVINADGRVCRLDRWTGRTELLRGNRWVETMEAETKQKTIDVEIPSVQVKQSVQPVKTSVQPVQAAPQSSATPQKPYDQMTREELDAEEKRLMNELGITDVPQLRQTSGLTAGDVREIELPGGAKMKFVWCPPGSFTMGSPTDEEGRCYNETQHRVTLTKGFWLGQFEVTQRQWERVMGNNPSYFKGDGNRPVEKVSWEDCRKFVEKCNAEAKGIWFALPTEAQWEYACRAGSTGPYAGTGHLDAMGWYSYNSGGTHPVGQKQPNAWNLHDMHGNVGEWCADWYGTYEGDCTDPTGSPSGSYRVPRGGSWGDFAKSCRSADRDYIPPSYISYYYGFRLCCSAGPHE